MERLGHFRLPLHVSSPRACDSSIPSAHPSTFGSNSAAPPGFSHLITEWHSNSNLCASFPCRFGLEAIYNCEENAFVQSQDSVRLNYNPQTPLGLKLKCYEDKLFEQSIEQIERTCHSNGQSAMGSKEDMIARLMLVEKYKLLKENKDLADEDYDKRLPQAPLSKPELLKLL